LFGRYASVLCRLQYLIYFILVWMRSPTFFKTSRAKRTEDVGCPRCIDLEAAFRGRQHSMQSGANEEGLACWHDKIRCCYYCDGGGGLLFLVSCNFAVARHSDRTQEVGIIARAL
jgi:hypothetical protein